jgi:hypothetical protein
MDPFLLDCRDAGSVLGSRAFAIGVPGRGTAKSCCFERRKPLE